MVVLFILWPACRIYISKRYIVIEGDNQGGAPWTLVLCRWNDGDHAMMHKMEIECVKDHIVELSWLICVHA
jgi:hypothetical protein